MMQQGPQGDVVDFDNEAVKTAINSWERHDGTFIDYGELKTLLANPENHEYLKALLQVQDQQPAGMYPLFDPTLADDLRHKFKVASTFSNSTWEPVDAVSVKSMKDLDTKDIDREVGFSTKDTPNPLPVFVSKEHYDKFSSFSIWLKQENPTEPGNTVIKQLEPVNLIINSKTVQTYRFVFETPGGTQKTLFLERAGLAELSLFRSTGNGIRLLGEFVIGDDGLLHKVFYATPDDLQSLEQTYDIQFQPPPEKEQQEMALFHAALGGRAPEMGVWRDGVYLGACYMTSQSKEKIEQSVQETLRKAFPPFEEFTEKMLRYYNVSITKVPDPSGHETVQISYANEVAYSMFTLTSVGERFALPEIKAAFETALYREITTDAGAAEKIFKRYQLAINDDGRLYFSDTGLGIDLLGNAEGGWNVDSKLTTIPGRKDVILHSWVDTKTGQSVSEEMNIAELAAENARRKAAP